MDIKLKTSEMLLQKLAFGAADARLSAIAEIRLFCKWDDANRLCLLQAGAIPPLLKILDDDSVDSKMKEIATAALINMSINEQAKLALAYVPGAVDTVIRTIGDSQSKELKSVAAGLLYSLIINDELKTIICLKDSLWDSVIGLLKETSGKCKSEALKLLFVLAKDERWRNKLMQEDNELVSLLISLLTAGMPKLTEDCLTVISLLARSGAGTKAILDDKSSIPIFVYLLNSGSPRAQENAASVLNNMCQQDGNVKEILPLQTLIPALNSLMRGGSDRGKSKAASLLRVLQCDTPPSLSTASNLSDAEADLYPDMSSELRSAESVPVMPTYADEESSSVLQVPQSLNTVSSPSSEPQMGSNHSRWPKHIKYLTVARTLFHHRSKRNTGNRTL